MEEKDVILIEFPKYFDITNKDLEVLSLSNEKGLFLKQSNKDEENSTLNH